MFTNDRAMVLELEAVERYADPRPAVTPGARRPEGRGAVESLERLALLSPGRARDELAMLGLLTVGRRDRGLGHFSLTSCFRGRKPLEG